MAGESKFKSKKPAYTVMYNGKQVTPSTLVPPSDIWQSGTNVLCSCGRHNSWYALLQSWATSGDGSGSCAYCERQLIPVDRALQLRVLLTMDLTWEAFFAAVLDKTE